MRLRRSLVRKYVVYIVALVSSALMVSGLVGLYYTYQESKTARLNLQREKAEAAASRIESYMQNIEHQLGWMRFPQFGVVSPEQRRIEYLKLLRQVPAITDVRHIDASGREQLRLSRIDRSELGSNADLSQDPRFVEPRGGRTWFSPVYFRQGTEPYLTIAVAGAGDDPAVTAAEVNLKFIWDVITRIKVGAAGHAYLVDARGNLIAHPDISQVLRKVNLSGLAQVKAALTDAPARVMLAADSRGGDVLVGYASIAPLGWHVFVEQPLDEALAPLYASLERTALLLLAGLVLGVLVSLLLARHMVTPIRAIQAGAARIAAGKLDQRIDVRTGDELEALAGEFNNMASQLSESYAGLERIVEERTRDLTESLVQQTATSEVLKTISRSSFDLDRVLEELARSAVKLGRADGAAIYQRQQNGRYELRIAFSENATLTRFVETHAREVLPEPDTAAGRAVASRQPIQIDDVALEPMYRWPQAGFRTALAVPIVREGAPVGIFVAVKVLVQPFTDKQIALITTFADQAGIAIENVRMIDELRTKGMELELANRHKSEFLANVSHELRTPLNAIIGFSEVLRERMFGELNDKQAEYLNDIHGAGRDLLALINDILDLSKIEAGRMELELSRFDLAEALQRSLAIVRERAARKRIALALELPPQGGEIVADARKFKQIMLNLLSNAVAYTPDDGKVAVRAELVSDGVRIAVSDTGVGIDRADLDDIFEPFRRGTAKRVREGEGTGLGLALTRRFVELHGGAVEVRSELGSGSTFTFFLPGRQSTP